MLAADLSLEDLRTQIMEDIKEINEKYEQGQEHQSYFFIVDRKGTYVMHPDPERMLKSFDSEVGKMMMKHRGTCVTKVDGVMSRLLQYPYAPAPHPGCHRHESCRLPHHAHSRHQVVVVCLTSLSGLFHAGILFAGTRQLCQEGGVRQQTAHDGSGLYQ